MSKTSKKKKKKDLTVDFGISVEGMEQFFAMSDFGVEDIEACVDFFEKFVKVDFPKYLKAKQAIRSFVNASLCVGNDDLRDQRNEVLSRMDQFMMDLADFR